LVRETMLAFRKHMTARMVIIIFACFGLTVMALTI